MTVEQTARNLVSAWNSHDAARVAELFAAQCEAHDVADAAPSTGRDGVAEAYRRIAEAAPDLRLDLQEIVAIQHTATVFWEMQGTHLGPFMRIPPTGRPFSVAGAWLLAVKPEGIARIHAVWDVAGMLRAIGLLPDLQPASPTPGAVAGS